MHSNGLPGQNKQPGLLIQIRSWWLRLCGQQVLSVEERRKADLSLVSQYLAVLEHAEEEQTEFCKPLDAVTRRELEVEAILLENAAIEAGGEGGVHLDELQRREHDFNGRKSGHDALPARRLPAYTLLVFFDPVYWFPPKEMHFTITPPPSSMESLLECQGYLNRQANLWFDTRWQHAQAFDDTIAAGRKRILERLRLFARLDECTPPQTLESFDAIIQNVRRMADSNRSLVEGTRRVARGILGDPLRYETIEAITGHFNTLADILSDNVQWLRLLRRAWSRSPAPGMLLEALKSELRYGASLPDGFEEQLAGMLNEWKKYD